MLDNTTQLEVLFHSHSTLMEAKKCISRITTVLLLKNM